MEYKIKVEGMSCGGCANAVKSKLITIEGVQSAEVNHTSKMADIKASQELTRTQVEAVLASTSYEVESFETI